MHSNWYLYNLNEKIWAFLQGKSHKQYIKRALNINVMEREKYSNITVEKLWLKVLFYV